MLDKTQDLEETELWNAANNPPEKTYDFFGKIEIKLFKGAYETGTRGAVPFNPAVHEKGHAIVKLYIEPLPEINIKYTNQLEYESPVWAEWGKVTFPSIKALGIDNAHEINGKYARVARVPSGKKYTNKDGELKDETTFKFIEFYADENECRTAYITAGGQPVTNGNNGSINVPVSTEDSEKATALAFLKVIVTNAARGKLTTDEAETAVASALAGYPTVSKFYSVDSPETVELINQVLPPFQP